MFFSCYFSIDSLSENCKQSNKKKRLVLKMLSFLFSISATLTYSEHIFIKLNLFEYTHTEKIIYKVEFFLIISFYHMETYCLAYRMTCIL